MKSLILISMSLILATSTFAQADTKPDAKPTAEARGTEHEKTIPADVVSRFFKSQSHVLAAQQQLDSTPQASALKDASSKFQAVLQEMTQYCGKGYNLMIDNKTEDPACAPIPEKKETPKDTKPATPSSPK